MDRLNVGIFVFPQVEVLDFAGPYEVFSRTRTSPGVLSRRSEDTAPFRVFTVAKSSDTLAATGGLKITPDYSFADAPHIDILIVPGGFGTRSLLEDQETLRWLKETASKARRTASVCTGALLLAKIGLLDNKRATTHWASLALLQNLGQDIRVEPQSRYVDDNIVTSAGVSAGIDMAFYLVEKFCGRAVAEETAHYIEYRR